MTSAPLPQEFYTGTCFDAYRFLGAHPVSGVPAGGWAFRVWAPSALEVRLCGDFNGWQGQLMAFAPGGIWSLTVPTAREGQLYKYEILGRDGSRVLHSDPYAFGTEVRPKNASVLTRLDFCFDDAAWMENRDKCRSRPLNIYELHAGSWRHRSPEETLAGPAAWYDYEQLAARLIPWLTEHHYTHVELLPLSEHPFDGSWGYQTTGYFSVTSRYGTPRQFAAFVSACHKAGIGVLMDFVPVHFAANADGLARFDGTCLYEYDSDVGHSEWGTCNFNFYRGEVRSFLSSACAMWMDVYHCDGIRMDAVSRAIYWMGDPARGVNEGAVKFVQSVNHGLNERWPTGIYVAEDSTNYLKVTVPTRYGGLGFDYKWDLGWMHDTRNYFATPFGERPAHYHALTFSMQYFYNELYLLSFSHDEVVHGKKTILDGLWGTYAEKCSQARTLYFYMYTHPGKKLNFMGNELGHFREWDEARELDWGLLRYPFHDMFQKYMARLGSIYQNEPALYDGEYDSRCFEWVACESIDECLYAWLRQSRGQTLLCIMNTSDRALSHFPLYLKFPCRAVLLLNTEAAEWGGESAIRAPLHTTSGGVYGRDFTLKVNVPAMGSLLYRLEREYPQPETFSL
ncbi:MAG: 1,4-alpha-glucan branching protein GlgB [Faecalibacterium sp.]|jgi:1,4-alpha-glucan branching enzyme|nr:1,4-alpha-glucan branching protein GlgB [Faecalibacterium sp.]